MYLWASQFFGKLLSLHSWPACLHLLLNQSTAKPVVTLSPIFLQAPFNYKLPTCSLVTSPQSRWLLTDCASLQLHVPFKIVVYNPIPVLLYIQFKSTCPVITDSLFSVLYHILFVLQATSFLHHPPSYSRRIRWGDGGEMRLPDIIYIVWKTWIVTVSTYSFMPKWGWYWMYVYIHVHTECITLEYSKPL